VVLVVELDVVELELVELLGTDVVEDVVTLVVVLELPPPATDVVVVDGGAVVVVGTLVVEDVVATVLVVEAPGATLVVVEVPTVLVDVVGLLPAGAAGAVNDTANGLAPPQFWMSAPGFQLNVADDKVPE